MIERGCLVGTVGGPAIFSMLRACRASHNTSLLTKYSDDMNSLILCFKNPSNEEKNVLDKERSNLFSYANEKELDINHDKSKEMQFCFNRHPFCQCEQKNLKFQTIEEAKLLGITFEADCSFLKHCRQLLRKLRSCLYLLKIFVFTIFQSNLFTWFLKLLLVQECVIDCRYTEQIEHPFARSISSLSGAMKRIIVILLLMCTIFFASRTKEMWRTF